MRAHEQSSGEPRDGLARDPLVRARALYDGEHDDCPVDVPHEHPGAVSRETRVPAYIYEPPNEWHPGLLREHIVAPFPHPTEGDQTLCGITYMSLPDNFPPIVEDDGTIQYDKPWYYDHDVDVTFDCRSCIRILETLR